MWYLCVASKDYRWGCEYNMTDMPRRLLRVWHAVEVDVGVPHLGDEPQKEGFPKRLFVELEFRVQGCCQRML